MVHCEIQCSREMKMRFAICLALLAGLLMAVIAITCIKPPAGHCDFNLRMNEIKCVVHGVNPFYVWNEDIEFPPYTSNIPKKPIPEGCTEPVNAYAPWEYMYMMPLSFVPPSAAWFFYCVAMGIAVLLLVFFSRPTNGRALQEGDSIVLAAVPLVIVSYLLWSNASVGNFIVFVLSASVLMAWALSRNRWFLSGVLWAVAMVKPQSAILFAVPLLIRGRLSTCVVAVTTCLSASVLPSFMCRSSIVDMLIQGPAANAELFNGCGTWPRFLCGFLGGAADIGIGLAIGAALCVWMTWVLRRENDWLVYLMPAAICASCWTYTQAYSHAMGWFVAYAIVSSLLQNPRSKFLWILLCISIPILSRAFLAWHGFCVFFEMTFPMSEYAFRCLDSLNSTAALVIAAAYCLWRGRTLELEMRSNCAGVINERE